MDWGTLGGWIGGIAGGAIGLAGGVIGTYFTVKNTKPSLPRCGPGQPPSLDSHGGDTA
jgi:hypothetical protein